MVTAYTRALGARLLAEANDLKRTPESLAEELGIPLARIQSAIDGALQPEEYRSLFERVTGRYPVAFGRLWIEPTDARCGLRNMTADESRQSSRIFTRRDRNGALTPYYEYRDTAMSQLAPFRPEWIRELRVVGDADPDNPDVAYNKGHFLHQTTFFIGPVNFYWEVHGKRYCAELETGDSNYITPFWPHSFASRDASRTALIIAVTYGGEVARARDEAGRMGAEMLRRVTIDLRDARTAHAGVLQRHLQSESISEAAFADECGQRGLDPGRIGAIVAAEMLPTPHELQVMADVLAVSVRDLLPPSLNRDEDVIVLRRAQAPVSEYPDRAAASYRIARLARSRHQPYLKSFVLMLIEGRKGAELRVPLHQYIYNHGDQPVSLHTRAADGEREATLAPGDSAYLSPMTGCTFNGLNGRGGELYIVRIPGDLQTEAVFELSGMAPSGWDRVAAETTRWF